MNCKNLFHSTIMVASLGLVAACADKEPTLGDQLKNQGDAYRGYAQQWDAGQNKILKGERLIKEGKKEVKLGEKKIDRGEDLIDEGKKQKAKVEKQVQNNPQ